MLSERKKAVVHLFSAVQTGKLYSSTHPKFHDAIENAYKSLKETLENRTELVIGMVDEEVACEDEIYFDLSRRFKSSIIYFLERNIEKIFIHKAFDKDELSKFVSVLNTSKKELQADAQKFLALQGIRNIKTGRIKDYSLLQMDGTDDWDALRKLYDTSIDAYAQAMDSVLNLEEVDGLDLRFNLLNVMENFMGRHQEIMNLIEIKRKDLLTFVHLLNVSILAMHISSKLGLTKDDVLDVGVAALFHDIGKMFISAKILRKKSSLTEREFTKIKDHTILGSRILCEYRNSLGHLPAVVAFEHHLRYDLSGYPKLTYEKKPYIASFIVSICDVYDALAQRRTYKKDSPPNEIYETMIEEKGKLFHPQILDRFFEVIGVWPVGTIVSLNDKSVAVVREINEADIFHPKVEVISPIQKKRFIDLEKEKRKFKIEKALNPFGRGKEFINFVKR
ncbi:MAG: HD domain-containing protein [Candidatus Aminicenantes bacterium]|jgi:putative nucleotidyltransferase with HDIG domain